jgi:hypothetical protein
VCSSDPFTFSLISDIELSLFQLCRENSCHLVYMAVSHVG